MDPHDIHSPFNACMHRAGCQQTQAAHVALLPKVDTLRKNAERYRMWRAAYTDAQTNSELEPLLVALANALTPAKVDAVLDAALAAGTSGPHERMTMSDDATRAVGATLERQVRPLCDRLRDAACDEANLREKAADALEKLDALLRSMQADATQYLVPDSGCGAEWFVSRMLWHLDGPAQREAQGGVTNG